jgi:hypothetical protein
MWLHRRLNETPSWIMHDLLAYVTPPCFRLDQPALSGWRASQARGLTKLLSRRSSAPHGGLTGPFNLFSVQTCRGNRFA